jgi:hypothetical protein
MRALAIALLANNAAAAPLHGRELSQLNILRYQPGSDVIDHERIDLDQNAVENSLSTPDFLTAQLIYQNGAYSKPSAVCTIVEGTPPATVTKKDGVFFESANGYWTQGKAYATYTGLAKGSEFLFTYPVPDAKIVFPSTTGGSLPTQDTGGSCWVGNLPAGTTTANTQQAYDLCIKNSEYFTTPAGGNSSVWFGTGTGGATGCSTGSSSAGQTTCTTVSAEIIVTCTNRGKRTLQGFSTAAKAKMYLAKPAVGADCPAPKDSTTNPYKNGCPYTSFVPYFDYYCGTGSPCAANGDYANQIVEGALNGNNQAATLTNGGMSFATGGTQDVTYANTEAARVQIIKKGTSYLNSWMYAIREFEDAIDDCSNGDLTANAASSGPVHAWDEGVAFYVGSIPSVTLYTIDPNNIADAPNAGVQPYLLGNKRCSNFKTCGVNGDQTDGEAYINQALWPLFQEGNTEIIFGNCAKVVGIKDKIVAKMTVPLVQGTLRYAFKQSAQVQSNLAKAKAEGAIFAAGVLPQVAACSATHAQTIFDNLSINNKGLVDFMAVKAAFEACYSDMGILCSEVGGLWDGSAYYSGTTPTGTEGVEGSAFDASPCKDPEPAMTTTTTEDLSDAALAGIIVGAVLAGLLLVFVVVLVMKEKSGTPMFYSVQEPASKQ